MAALVLPLDSLLIRLQQKGIYLDPSIRIKLQTVLTQLGNDYLDRPDRLKQIIGPVLVNNEEEQILFREVFDQWYQEEIAVSVESEVQHDSHKIAEEEVKAKVQKRRIWLYPIAVVLIIFSFWLINSKNQSVDYSHGNQAIDFEDVEIVEEQKEEVDINPTYPEEFASPSDQLHPEGFADRIVITSDKNIVTDQEATFSFDKLMDEKNIVVTWNYGDGEIYEGLEGNYIFTEPGLYHISAQIQAYITAKSNTVSIDGQDFNFLPNNEKILTHVKNITKSFIVQPPELSIAALKLKEQEALSEIDTKQTQIKFLVFFLAISLIILIEGYLYSYGQSIYTLAFKREFAARDKGNFKLPFPAQNSTLEAEPALYELANSLKYRHAGQSNVLDVQATIYSTVKSGGFPDLQYTTRTESSEYLVLIDESGPEDHQAKLFEQLMVLLKQEEVPIHLFRFRNDPRHCYNQHFPNGLELEVLAQKFYRHKLLIFSKGTFMVHPTQNSLYEWVAPLMKRWAYRVLLTPEPVHEWSIRERELQSIFTLLPTDLESQKGITEALIAEDQPDFDQLQEELLAKNNKGMPLEGYDFESVEDLQDYLGDSVFQWLAATSVYPEPRWEMTLQIGQTLEKHTELATVIDNRYGSESSNNGIAESRQLVTYQNLNKLSSIPWLREGNLSPELREALLQKLDPETEILAREAAIELIEEVEAEEGSGIAQEKNIQSTIQEAAINPQDKILQKKLRFLWAEKLLSKENQTVVSDSFEPTWTMKLGQIIPVRSIVMIMLPLSLLGFGGMEYYQNRHRDLFEEFFVPLEVNAEINHNGSPDNDFSGGEFLGIGINLYQKGQYLEANEKLHSNSQYLAAIDYLEKFLGREQFPPTPDTPIDSRSNYARSYLAMAYLKLEQPDKAIQHLNSIAKTDKNLANFANWYKGLAYLDLEQNDKAESIFIDLAMNKEKGTYHLLARRILKEM